ncbi:MAG: heavy metal-associated domain-containing protein [Rhodothermales bacterium]
MKKNWNLFGALGAGLAASACCTIPLILVSVGVGGGLVGMFTAMEPFRPLFVAVAVVALYLVVRREIARSRQVDCDCDDQRLSDRARRSLIVAGIVITLGLVASPWLIRPMLDAKTATAPDFASEQQVTLTVSGMTCELCDITVARALLGLEGVTEAIVTFEPPQAVVRFNPSLVSVADMERITREIGYPASVKSATTHEIPTQGISWAQGADDKAAYSIESPFCSGCVDGLISSAKSIDGVLTASVNIPDHLLHITFNPDVVSYDALTERLREKTALKLVPVEIESQEESTRA